jgi:hypothetical protein
LPIVEMDDTQETIARNSGSGEGNTLPGSDY